MAKTKKVAKKPKAAAKAKASRRKVLPKKGSGAAKKKTGAVKKKPAAARSKTVAKKKTAAKRKPLVKKKAAAKRKPPAKKKAAAKRKPPAKKKAATKRKAAVKPKARVTRKAPAKPRPKPKRKPTAKTKPVPKRKPAAKAKPVPKRKPTTKAKPVTRPAASAKAPMRPRVVPPVPVTKVTRPTPRPARRAKGKLLPREFLLGLGRAIKEAVAPVARTVRGREIVDMTVSGDATFELDRIAERALLAYLKGARAPVAYYSEDAGYSTFSNEQPKHLLVVDPIDGTRAAKSGFEGCVVSIASTRVIERPAMADVDSALVMEILGERSFFAERGKGVRIHVDDHLKRPKLSDNANLEMVTWAMTVPARPAELIFPTAARLIDLTSLKGGFFACNSTSFSLTRLLTNQLDACVDFSMRFMRDIPDLVHDYFINAGRGKVIGIAPYDMAAALLIAQEAGCIVTDAYGQGFDDVLLLDSSEGNHQSLIAAANPALHEKLLSFFDTRIRQFEGLLMRRAAANGR